MPNVASEDKKRTLAHHLNVATLYLLHKIGGSARFIGLLILTEQATYSFPPSRPFGFPTHTDGPGETQKPKLSPCLSDWSSCSSGAGGAPRE